MALRVWATRFPRSRSSLCPGLGPAVPRLGSFIVPRLSHRLSEIPSQITFGLVFKSEGKKQTGTTLDSLEPGSVHRAGG